MVWPLPHRRPDPRGDRLRGGANIKIAKVNVDENQQYAGQLGVFNIPTMVVYKNGQPVDKIIGAMPKNAIMARVKPHMA